MTTFSSLGAGTAGLWTRAQALEVTSRGRLDHLVATGVWQSPLPGVHSDGGTVLDPVQRAFDAYLASGGGVQHHDGRRALRAVPSHRTAARVWGLPLVDDDPVTGGVDHLLDDVLVLTGSGRDLVSPRGEGDPRARALMRHRGALSGDDLVRLPSGLWVTTPLRTVMDCLLVVDHEAAVCLLDHGLHEQLFTVADLAPALEARTGRPGVRLQARAVAVAAADSRAESPNETLARPVLMPVLPGLVPQYRLRDSRGRVLARFDLADPEVRLGVEADGRRGHPGEQMVAKDQRRDRRAEAYGWSTERVRWFELRREQEQVRRRVLARRALQVARAA